MVIAAQGYEWEKSHQHENPILNNKQPTFTKRAQKSELTST